MTADWPSVDYSAWRETCDTLHAHTQVLGKVAVALAQHEPQLQHGALRLTARGWETRILPAPNGSGAFVAALDLRGLLLPAGAASLAATMRSHEYPALSDALVVVAVCKFGCGE